MESVFAKVKGRGGRSAILVFLLVTVFAFVFAFVFVNVFFFNSKSALGKLPQKKNGKMWEF